METENETADNVNGSSSSRMHRNGKTASTPETYETLDATLRDEIQACLSQNFIVGQRKRNVVDRKLSQTGGVPRRLHNPR